MTELLPDVLKDRNRNRSEKSNSSDNLNNNNIMNDELVISNNNLDQSEVTKKLSRKLSRDLSHSTSVKQNTKILDLPEVHSKILTFLYS